MKMQKESSTFMEPKIRLIDVSIGYMSNTVIEKLSLDIAEGEMMGIFGPNGAGKTTLLCAINGLAKIVSGKVFIAGRQVTRFNGNMFRKDIGYVPQDFEIDPRLPVLAQEVILMGRYGKIGCFRYAGTKEKHLLAELVDLLNISNILKKPFGQLSGGEKKRVFIARALMQEPTIMLFDEVFAWLDSETSRMVIDVIQGLHKNSSLTTLIVSHQPSIIEKLCSRIIWMKEGKIIMDGDTSSFLQKIRASYGTI